MTRQRFQQLVAEALDGIPRRFRAEMKNVAVVVEDEPPAHILAEMDIEPPDSLFGLYQGTPLPERSWSYGNALPDRISIYQGPIEDACDDDDEIRDCVAETVIHEFGHYFGMDEDQIEEIFAKLGRDPERVKCAAMVGLISEGDEIVDATGDADVLDAALIGAAQRVEHYEIAAYGTARTFARRLGNSYVAELLQQTLDEEGDTDKKLTNIAEQKVNPAAV